MASRVLIILLVDELDPNASSNLTVICRARNLTVIVVKLVLVDRELFKAVYELSLNLFKLGK